MPRGGKRKGAGRKPAEPTKRMSIPVSLVERVLNFVKKLKSDNENPNKKASN